MLQNINITNMDSISSFSDEEIDKNINELNEFLEFISKKKNSGDLIKKIEVELSYFFREKQLRQTRVEIHKKYITSLYQH